MSLPPAPALVRWSAPDPDAVDDPLLTERERARCAEYRRPIDAARHATGRALARAAGAALLGASEAELVVVVDDGPTRGRPRLARRDEPALAGSRSRATPGRLDPTRLHLSIAHSGDVVMVAVAEVPCGLDVELVESVAPLLDNDVAFNAGELAVIATAGPGEGVDLAARWWTAKEAVLKATGTGLVDDPSRLDARCATVTVDLQGRSGSWRLTAIDVPAGHRAMLATPAKEPIDLRVEGPTDRRHRVAQSGKPYLCLGPIASGPDGGHHLFERPRNARQLPHRIT